MELLIFHFTYEGGFCAVYHLIDWSDCDAIVTELQHSFGSGS